MFSIVSFGTALLAAQAAYALPRPDSSSGDEVGVRAPNGTPITDTAELAAQSSAEAASSAAYKGSYNNGGYYTQASDTAKAMETSSMMMYSASSSSSSSSMMAETTTSAMMDTTTSAMYESTSSVMMDTTSTSEAMSTTTTSVSYGSGSSSWNSGGYDSCVQQCIASFGNPMATYTPSSTSDSSSSNSSSGSSGSGSGATHTIIVAPTQGVLRYVPFATNASVGDTIKFMWNANMHTVTKSSSLEVCNKTSDAPFTSGVQNQSFVFTQVVNDTNPTFFYCGVPTHCQKGMFGIINPPSAASTDTSVAGMMSAVASNDSNVAAWAAYTQNMTASNAMAASWGLNMDMASIPEWAYSDMMENVMYTQNFLAANPDVLTADGSVDLGATSAPLMVPQDLNAALAASSSSSSASGASGSAATSSASAAGSSASSSTAGAASSSARGLKASSFLAGSVALGAIILAL